MTEVEAGEFVVRLVAHYPGVKFTERNAHSYQSLLVTLGRDEADAARLELAETNKFIPSFAEIREVVMRNRRNARLLTVAKPAQLPEGNRYPSPQEWGRRVDRMLTEAERYEHMARAWYASKGKQYPGDPAAGIIEMVKAGARGDDISDGLRKVVGDEQAQEEQDEIERRFP